MDLSWEKWLVMGALALISIALGMIPYILFNSKRSILPAISAQSSGSLAFNLTLTVLSCFGGGVLLSTALVHMLPEAREELSAIPTITEHFDEHFPAAEILTIIGFGLIYLIEEIAHWMLGQDSHDHHEIVRHNSSTHSIGLDGRISANKGAIKAASKEEETVRDPENVGRTVRSILALIALSFHAIMEGIAVGIQENESLWFMFGAVASHKFVISFCMGIELYATRAKLPAYVGSIVFFGAISSVGILIGTLISSDDSNTLAIAVIKGLATGTLLYVVFFEILSRERSKKVFSKFRGLSKVIGFLQFVSISLGMTAMVLLFTFAGHSHEHDHDHDHDHETVTEDPGHDHTHDHDHDHDYYRLGGKLITKLPLMILNKSFS